MAVGVVVVAVMALGVTVFVGTTAVVVVLVDRGAVVVLVDRGAAVVLVDRGAVVVLVDRGAVGVVVVVGPAAFLCPSAPAAGEWIGEGGPPLDTTMAITPPRVTSTRAAMAVRRTVPPRRVIGVGVSLAMLEMLLRTEYEGGPASSIETLARPRLARTDGCIKLG